METATIKNIINKYNAEISEMEKDFIAFREKYPNEKERIEKMQHRINILLDMGVCAEIILKK